MELLEQTLNSMEVAEMVGKEHKNLLRDISRYCKQMNAANEELINERKIELVRQLKIEPSDFFKESTYKNEQNKTQPCYLVTKKGCEFIAHKMTGVRGTAFTARYINRFYEMEEAIKQLALQKQREQEQKQLEHSSTYLLPMADQWFNEMNDIFERVCRFYNWERKRLYHEILNELGDRYNIPQCIEIYKIEKGEPPKYIMDVVEWFPQLRDETVRIMRRYSSVVPLNV